MHFHAEPLRASLRRAAAAGVHLGTSSWKYPGWLGQLYDEQRYLHRGKFTESRFDRGCLAEYAECFSTVCVDAAYYQFPRRAQLENLAQQVGDGFLFSFKVTEEITLKRFTRLPRYGARAGTVNANFLNAGLFCEAFLHPCEAIRPKVGLLMFEFSKFHAGDWEHGRDFVAALDRFLGALPRGWHYGVEIRNRTFLHPEYFSMLARHGVTHVFNSWEAMPPVSEQLALPGSQTNPSLVAARFLLKPGRKYEDAVSLFSPYENVRESVPEAREAGAKLIVQGLQSHGRTKTMIYVNNRLEGNALQTIAAMLAAAGDALPPPP